MSGSVHTQKRDLMLEFLDRGLVMVHIDPRVDGVVVPEYLTHDVTLRLNIAYGFNLPSLEIDEEGIYAVLSFGGVNHGCTIPWESVFALTMPDDERGGRIWPSSLPPELVEAAQATAASSEGPDDAEPTPAAGPALRVVEDIAPEADATTVSEAPEEAPPVDPPVDPPTLRLVTD